MHIITAFNGKYMCLRKKWFGRYWSSNVLSRKIFCIFNQWVTIKTQLCYWSVSVCLLLYNFLFPFYLHNRKYRRSNLGSRKGVIVFHTNLCLLIHPYVRSGNPPKYFVGINIISLSFVSSEILLNKNHMYYSCRENLFMIYFFVYIDRNMNDYFCTWPQCLYFKICK